MEDITGLCLEPHIVSAVWAPPNRDEMDEHYCPRRLMRRLKTNVMRMLFGSGLAVLLLLVTSSAGPQPCRCSVLPSAVLQVSCSSLNLTEVPPLSLDTTELHLQDNHLSRVPPGHFDRLQSLRSVTLSGNPFHCDCGIQYLWAWLRRNRAVVSGAVPTCASPGSVAHAAVTSLSESYFSSCGRRSCVDGAYGVLVGSTLCGVIGLLLWSLWLAKNSTFTLDITRRHAGLNLESLRSLKPKHRRRLRRTLCEDSENSAPLTWTDDTGRPAVNTQMLPQRLNVLHKKHVKIKAI